MRNIKDYKVGQKWKTRKNTEVVILAIKEDAKYPIKGECQENGLRHMFGICGHTVPGVDADIDLVELISQ